jgi:hypothetical protein
MKREVNWANADWAKLIEDSCRDPFYEEDAFQEWLASSVVALPQAREQRAPRGPKPKYDRELLRELYEQNPQLGFPRIFERYKDRKPEPVPNEKTVKRILGGIRKKLGKA